MYVSTYHNYFPRVLAMFRMIFNSRKTMVFRNKGLAKSIAPSCVVKCTFVSCGACRYFRWVASSPLQWVQTKWQHCPLKAQIADRGATTEDCFWFVLCMKSAITTRYSSLRARSTRSAKNYILSPWIAKLFSNSEWNCPCDQYRYDQGEPVAPRRGRCAALAFRDVLWTIFFFLNNLLGII